MSLNQQSWRGKKGLNRNPFPAGTEKYYTYRYYDFPRTQLARCYAESTLRCRIVQGDYLVYACPKQKLWEFLFGHQAYRWSARQLVEVHSMRGPEKYKENPSNPMPRGAVCSMEGRRPTVSIRRTRYRGKEGFLIVEQLGGGFGARIFTDSHAKAERIRDAIRSGSQDEVQRVVLANPHTEFMDDSRYAEEGYWHFHGSESQQIISDEIDWPPPKQLEEEYGPFKDIPRDLTALGELIALLYEDIDTLEEEKIEFRKECPMLASDYAEYDEGEEDLYIVGGDYKVPKKPDLICGPLIWVEYRTIKSFDDMKPTVYRHRFDDPWPILAQNKRADQLYILRGDSEFFIDRSSTVSKGIDG